MIVSVLENLAVSTLGPDARLTPTEHALIDEPLAATLARVPVSEVERINAFLSPLLLGLGLVLYAARIAKLASASAEKADVKVDWLDLAAPGRVREE